MSPALQKVADAIRDGNKIEAMRLLRDATGMSLEDASAAVEKLIAEGAASSAGGAPSTPLVTGSAEPVSAAAEDYDFATALSRDLEAIRAPRDPSVKPLEGQLADQVAILALQNKYLDAIKLVRASTGADLKTAKDQVELLMMTRGIVQKSNRSCVVIAVAIIIAIAGVILAVVFATVR